MMNRIRHNPLTTAALLLATVGLSGSAQALEFGLLRPMQNGPVGDSPQFTELGDYEGEGVVRIERNFGKYTRNGISDTKVGGGEFKTRVAVGGGLSPTKNFGLTAYADLTLASDFDEEQTRVAPKSQLDTGPYRHEGAILAFYKSNPIVIGGGIGLLLVGSEEREFKYDGNKYRSNITSAAMPVLRLFGGLSTKQFDGTIGVRFFSMGEAVVTAEQPGGKKSEYDIVRRNPGEIHTDAKLKLGQASLAASVAYVLTGQASEQIDEFSSSYIEVGDVKTRDTGSARRNTDHVNVAVGGRWDPTKMIGLMSSLAYKGASYAKPEYASLEHENLGGIRFDLGTEIKIQKFRGSFDAGYTIDSSESFTVKDDSRNETNIDRTQRAPLNKGDKVKISQGSWTIVAGGGIVL